MPGTDMRICRIKEGTAEAASFRAWASGQLTPAEVKAAREEILTALGPEASEVLLRKRETQ